MKTLLLFALQALILLFTHAMTAAAQAPPGWAWVHHFGEYSATGSNGAVGVGRDATGNLYVAGNYVGSPVIGGTATTNLGQGDIFLAKYSPAGNLLWLKLLQGSGNDFATALVVEPTGRCTLAGSFGGGSGGNLSFPGIGANSPVLAGPALLGLAVSGGPATGTSYQPIPFVVALDANGALLWFDNPSPTYGLQIDNLRRDGSGNCYLSINTAARSQLLVNGINYAPVGTFDAVLLKYSAAGLPLWARRVGSPNGWTTAAQLLTDSADALYWQVSHTGTISLDQVTVAPGAPTGATSLIKLSAGNTVRWVNNDVLRAGTANALTKLLTFDASTNTLYLAGQSSGAAISYAGASAPTVVPLNTLTTGIARCDTAGQVQGVSAALYVTNAAGTGNLAGLGVDIEDFALTGNGFTLLTNASYGGILAFPGTSRTLGTAESGLICVVHTNASTNRTEWVRVAGAPSTSGNTSSKQAVAMTVDAAGNVFVVGNYTGAAQFGAIILPLASIIKQEIFLAKLDQTVLTGGQLGRTATAWSVFPNPSTGTAQLVGLPGAARVEVYDALGRVVRELPAQAGPDAPRTVAGLQPGFYLLRVSGTVVPYQSQRLVVR